LIHVRMLFDLFQVDERTLQPGRVGRQSQLGQTAGFSSYFRVFTAKLGNPL
jgi:hypothetical protein